MTRRPAPAIETLESRRLLAQTGYWTFDETSGSTAADTSGSNTNAAGYGMTLSNAPAWQATGVVGRSVAFNGTTQYGDAGTTPGASATLSVSLWFNATALKNQTPVDKTPNDASGLGWSIKLRSDGGLTFRVGSATNFTDTTVAGAYAAGAWTQVVATFAGGVANVYVNGQLRATRSGITQSPADTVTALRVAVPRAAATTEVFGGAIDDLKLWDQSVGATAVARAYGVDLLSESTAAGRLKKADLQWAVEDALADEAFGNATAAANTYADVQAMLGQNVGAAQASPANLFPVIPSVATNPILTDAMTRLNKLRANNARLDKNPATFTVTVSGGSYLSAYGGYYADGLNGTWALGDPQTSLYGDPRLLQATMRRFERAFGAINGGYSIADFGQSSELAQMYLMFRTVYPDLLLPSKKTAWEAALKTDADKIMADHAATYNAGALGVSWVNADVRWAATLGYDALIFPTQTAYTTAANSEMSIINRSVYPDGGMPYIDQQNEDFTYHGINITTLTRYWQVTGNADAHDAVVKSYWYYPLSIEPSGVVPYGTDPAWKHYWNTVNEADVAYLVGTVARSPENRAVFQNVTKGSFTGLGTLSLAAFYDPSVTAAATPDNYIAYDRNDLGPRGRFGNFSFSGTSNPIAGQNRGVASFVGAMATDPTSTSSWPLSAALDSAQSRIEFANGQETGASNQSGLYYDLTRNAHAATTVTDHAAAITSVYNAAKYGDTTTRNWIGQQEWLLTSQRLVGLVSMRSTATQSAYDVEGILKLVSGRGSWGNVRQFAVTTDSDGIKRYTYGNLAVRVIQQNYGGVYIDYNDTMNPSEDTPSPKTGRIRFIDQQALANGGFDPNDTRNAQLDLKPSTYTSATNHYYLVEIFPTTSVPATSVTVDGDPLSTGVRGIAVTEGSRSYRLIDNPTSTTQNYSTTIGWSQGAIVHAAGETYRPSWLDAYTNADSDFRGRPFAPSSPTAVPAGPTTYAIPAYGHVLIESNSAPTVATAAAATPNPATGTTTLTALGADDGGEGNLTYTWATLGTPPAAVAFSSANGTNAGKSVVATFAKAGTYTFQVTVRDAGGLTVTSTVDVVVTTPPVVSSFTVNDGSAQRSMVTSLTVAFDQPVTIDGGGISLLRRVAGGSPVAVSFAVAPTSGAAGVYTLTFPAGTGRSLADGIYDLTVVAAGVRNAAGQPLAADQTYTFHRLFGDADGNRTVNNGDYLAFKNAFGSQAGSPSYTATFDYDANGVINNGDYLAFKNTFGVTYSY